MPVNLKSLNLEPTSGIFTAQTRSVRNAWRFQVIIEYAAGAYLQSAVADSPEEAVETFLAQPPGCEQSDIILFDRDAQRVVAFVKWKMGKTEIGLSVPRRENIYYDWRLAIVAMETLKTRVIAVAAELTA